MTISFDPNVEDDGPKYTLLDRGEYDFVVVEAEEKKSAAGNDMIECMLQVEDKKIREYLVFSDNARWRVRQFCKATGLYGTFQAGELSEDDVLGSFGRCEITTEPAKGEFKAKNKVDFYIELEDDPETPQKKDVPKPAKQEHVTIDDADIPF